MELNLRVNFAIHVILFPKSVKMFVLSVIEDMDDLIIINCVIVFLIYAP